MYQQKGGAGGKSRSSERNVVRKVQTRRERKPQENGGPKSKRARRSTSDQEYSNSEDEDQEEGMVNEKKKKTNGELEAVKNIKQDISDQEDQNQPRDAENGTGLTNGVMVEKADEKNEGMCHLNGEVKKEEVETEQIGVKPYRESSKPYKEMSAQSSLQTEQVTVTTTASESKVDEEQKPNVQPETVQPADVPPSQPVKRKY